MGSKRRRNRSCVPVDDISGRILTKVLILFSFQNILPKACFLLGINIILITAEQIFIK